jgi:hypothetical protein
MFPILPAAQVVGPATIAGRDFSRQIEAASGSGWADFHTATVIIVFS